MINQLPYQKDVIPYAKQVTAGSWQYLRLQNNAGANFIAREVTHKFYMLAGNLLHPVYDKGLGTYIRPNEIYPVKNGQIVLNHANANYTAIDATATTLDVVGVKGTLASLGGSIYYVALYLFDDITARQFIPISPIDQDFEFKVTVWTEAFSLINPKRPDVKILMAHTAATTGSQGRLISKVGGVWTRVSNDSYLAGSQVFANVTSLLFDSNGNGTGATGLSNHYVFPYLRFEMGHTTNTGGNFILEI